MDLSQSIGYVDEVDCGGWELVGDRCACSTELVAAQGSPDDLITGYLHLGWVRACETVVAMCSTAEALA